jgi:micrococcal nuclease
MFGTTLEVPVDRPVDGDTVRVMIEGRSESLRILALDTEESKAGGDKPVTPWGKRAAEHVGEIFQPGKMVTLEFEGNEPVGESLEKYRDNYGRLLVFVHVDGFDFQEHMIAEGYSPYFTKYGYARFDAYHRRYLSAERTAQAFQRGLWNQVAVNGSEQRNYAALGAWWALRAALIEDYRRARRAGAHILNSRLDFADIRAGAERGERAIVFTEVREFKRLGSRRAIIDIGSRAQPFKVFLPDIESPTGQQLVFLLTDRYITSGSSGRTVECPRRSYVYVRGTLKLFRDEPELELIDARDVFDSPEEALEA